MAILKKLMGASDSQVSLIGLQLGNRVLQIGHSDPHLIALLAAKVGLTGQASALVADDTARETLNRAAAARGWPLGGAQGGHRGRGYPGGVSAG